MATKTKQWADGSSATIQYNGQGGGQIIITSDANEHYEARSMQIVVETTDGSGIQRTITINQAAKQRIDLSTVSGEVPNDATHMFVSRMSRYATVKHEYKISNPIAFTFMKRT